mgnify:CR=1 FL=1
MTTTCFSRPAFQSRVVPVIVLTDPAHAVPLAHALLEGGIDVMEITLRSGVALQAMEAVARAVPKMHLGAGTVTRVAEVKQVMAAGATFPIGLFFVVLTGADLFTGNVMFVTTSLWAGHTTWQNAVKNLFVSYFGNIAGTLSLAYFMFHLTKLFQTPSIQAFVYGLADELVNQGSFGMNLLKGIGGNYLIGLALYAACVADDVMGKLVPLWWLAFAFIVIGFEHSIATAFFVPIAIMDGAPITAKAYIAKCLIPVTIGNMIGGCLFATVQTMMYSPVPGAAGNASSAPAWMLNQWPFLPPVTQVPGDLDKGMYSPAVSGTPSTPLDLEHPDESV